MPSKKIPVSPNAIAEQKSPDSERFILGAIMLDDAAFPAVKRLVVSMILLAYNIYAMSPEPSVKPSIQLCACGCGLPAPHASKTIRAIGRLKGQLLNYRRGHNTIYSDRLFPIGAIFGYLTIESAVIREKTYSATTGKQVDRKFVMCKCRCGATVKANLATLRTGRTSSCGCYNHEVVTKHGACKSLEYRCWSGMLGRCLNPKNQAYSYYGGRGIHVCAQWQHSFEQFRRDVGPRPSVLHTIERIDVNGDYEPHNVCWATDIEQSRNRRDNVFMEFDGQRLCVSAWAERLGIKVHVLRQRRLLGWPVERILTTPVRPKKKD